MSSDPNSIDQFFSCTQCGECCKGFGGTYVSDSDIAAIGTFMGLDMAVIRADYCAVSGTGFVLAQGNNGYCIFWDGNCTIHPVKPRMCRQWPFISGLRADTGNWQIMAGMCPGMNPDVSPAQLLTFLDSLVPLSSDT